jgi:hypothetical protein
VIFAGAGVLLQVCISPRHLLATELDPAAPQAAKDVSTAQEALIDIFERVENFFKRLETYTEVPPTAAMTDIIVKIMVEVLNIFAIATKEIKQGRTSEHPRPCSLLILLILDQKSFSKSFWKDGYRRRAQSGWTN